MPSDLLTLVEKLREVRPDIGISTDIIVGFPGETEKQFEETLELVKKVQYRRQPHAAWRSAPVSGLSEGRVLLLDHGAHVHPLHPAGRHPAGSLFRHRHLLLQQGRLARISRRGQGRQASPRRHAQLGIHIISSVTGCRLPLQRMSLLGWACLTWRPINISIR